MSVTALNHAPTTLTDLDAGDRVAIMRGSHKLLETTILERREVPAVPAVVGFAGREAATLVRICDGRWYDLDTAYENSGDGTRLRRAAKR